MTLPIDDAVPGAKIKEKHFITDDHKTLHEPQEFKKMIESIRNIERARGKKGSRQNK